MISRKWKNVTKKKCPQKTKPVDKQITHIEFACTDIEIWLDIIVKITTLNLVCLSNQWLVSFNALRHVIHDILNNCIWPDDRNFELEMCPVGTRMPRQGVMSVTQNDFGEMIYR